MKNLKTLDEVRLENVWLTIGAFDGVHLGHQQIIRSLVTEAHQTGAVAVVLTFFPHPAVYLQKIRGPFYLSSPDKRAEILYGLGVDTVITELFNENIANLSAQQYLDMLQKSLQIRQLWVGYDFAMGRGRETNVTNLRKMAENMGFVFRSLPAIEIDGEIVSSSQIRSMLLMGFVEDVIRKLGRPYQLDGVIVSGDRRGRHLGFPTANLQVMSQALIPENGVYACWATVRNQRYAAAVNIGVRPTFAGMETIPMIEVHLLDVFGKQDFYNERLSIDFITRLRSEQSFPNAQALSDQIDQDVRKTRAVLMTPEKVSI